MSVPKDNEWGSIPGEEDFDTDPKLPKKKIEKTKRLEKASLFPETNDKDSKGSEGSEDKPAAPESIPFPDKPPVAKPPPSKKEKVRLVDHSPKADLVSEADALPPPSWEVPGQKKKQDLPDPYKPLPGAHPSSGRMKNVGKKKRRGGAVIRGKTPIKDKPGFTRKLEQPSKYKSVRKKKMGCFLKLLIIFGIFVGLVAGGDAGWYAYLAFLEDDQATQEMGIVKFTEGRGLWVRDLSIEAYEWAKGLFESEDPPPSTGTAPPPETVVTAPPPVRVVTPIGRASRHMSDGDKFWRKSLRKGPDEFKNVKRALAFYRKSQTILNRLIEKDPENGEVDRLMQNVQEAIEGCIKQLPTTEIDD